MELTLGILQVLGITIFLPTLVGLGIAGSVITWDRRTRWKRHVTQLVCRIDTDCPPGYVCQNGVCVPTKRWRIRQWAW